MSGGTVPGAPAKSASETLAGLLVNAGLATTAQVSEAVASQQTPQDSLDKTLLERGVVSRGTLQSLLMDHYDVPFVAPPEEPEPRVLQLIPEHLLFVHQVFPISCEGEVLTLGMTEPDNAQAQRQVADLTGLRLRVVGLLEADFRQAFARHFASASAGRLQELEGPGDGGEGPAPDVGEGPGRSISRVLDGILMHAVRRRASDIHIEPQGDLALVRFRIDGVLQTQQVLPMQAAVNVTSRIKVLADLDITEKRVPQDGKFRHRLRDRAIDVRVSAIPGQYGEKLALRLLDRRSFPMGLELLGMPPEILASLTTVLSRPNGLFLVTGPTGSGKTTTLYSVIQRLRSPRVNIITLEDPIEYELLAGGRREGGVTQVQINRKVGLTFASGLRACLRQDPDIILVGEMRDRETAETAITAALTGHMVLSTLHTNGAIQTIARLLDMGVDPFLVVTAVRGILSQRLVRVLCRDCRQAGPPAPETLKALDLKPDAEIVDFSARGCDACAHQGYLGRTGVFEMIVLGHELQRLILERRPHHELAAKATRELKFKTLRQHGLDLVRGGVTTLDEVTRLLPSM